MIAKAYADQHQLKNPTQETPHTLSFQYSYGLSYAKYFVEEDYAQRLTCRYVWFSTRGLLPNLKVETNRKALRRNQKNPIPNERETRERERERETTAIVQGARRKEERRGERREREREGEREGVVFIPFLSFLHSSILPFVISFGGKKNKGFGSLRWMKTDKERIT